MYLIQKYIFIHISYKDGFLFFAQAILKIIIFLEMFVIGKIYILLCWLLFYILILTLKLN